MPPPTLATLFDRGTVATVDDADLLARFCANRDEAAFAALVGRHGPMVWATARGILGNDHDASDTFQTTFLILARRAASLRTSSSLAAWLHRVAFRSAVATSRASRQRHRIEQAAALVRNDGSTPDRSAQVRAEVARLPHSYRLAVILCDLEGLTYAEAAARVGCTEAALRNRLARARGRLRNRLEPGIILPPTLIPATVAVGLSQIGSRAIGGWIMSTIKLGVALAVLGGGVTVGMAMLARRPVLPHAAVQEDAPLVIRGRIISPKGQPVGGATVNLFVATQPQDQAIPTATSAADGRFDVSIPPQLAAAIPAFQPGGSARRPTPQTRPDLVLVATAPGFGVSWANADAFPIEAEVRLVESGPPVEGRVLDKAGQPVVGARVATLLVAEPKRKSATETPTAALNRVLARPDGQTNDEDLDYFPVGVSTTTDAAGRFRLDGLGAERLVMGQISGPTIATTTLTATTWPIGEIPTTIPVPKEFAGRDQPQFTNGGDWTAEPTRIIVGSVRDAQSGQPLSGWKVTGSLNQGWFGLFGPAAETTSDINGHYRLVGLPGFIRYKVNLEAPQGQPYVSTLLDAEAEPGLAPVTFDIALPRAGLARGRVTNQATGKPVQGLISFVHLEEPKFLGSSQVSTDAAGRYEIAMPIGRSLLAFNARDHDHYRLGQWARRITPPRDPTDLAPDNLAVYEFTFNALAEIHVEPGATAEVVDFVVTYQDAPLPVDREVVPFDPNRRVELTAIGPDGQPVNGPEVRGIGDMTAGLHIRQNEAKIILDDFGWTDTRRITARHRGRKLAGATMVTLDHGLTQVLRLEPWGEITGRVVTTDGTPIPRARIKPGPRFGPGSAVEPIDVLPGTNDDGGLVTAADGRFHVVGLVPGTHYGASVADFNQTLLGDLFADLTVAPGQIKDLGTIVIRPIQQD